VKKLISAMIIFTMYFSITSFHFVSAKMPKDQFYSIIKDGYTAQMELGGKSGTMEEIFDQLGDYFTTDFKLEFAKEHVFYMDGKYYVLGTDHPTYYIPTFSFNEHTKKMEINENEVVIYEYFSEIQKGPVQHDGLYNGIKIVNDHNQWKIDSILYDKDIRHWLEHAESTKKTTEKETDGKTSQPVEKKETNKKSSFIYKYVDTVMKSPIFIFGNFVKLIG